MIKDPWTVWDGQYPYDVLAPAGITPESSQAEIRDASFTLMTKGMMKNPVTQKAWDDLRNTQRRLLADFLLYDVDPAAELRQVRERILHELSESDEPPEVAAALTLHAELLRELTGELTDVTLEPRPVRVPRELDTFSTQSLIDSSIRFDR